MSGRGSARSERAAKRRREQSREPASEDGEAAAMARSLQASTGELGQQADPGAPPQPSELLRDCGALPDVVALDVTVCMDADAYEDALENARVCNVQLKAVGCSDSELAAHPARLPAGDAFMLSPVLRTCLKDDVCAKTEDGIQVIELRVSVPQPLLHTVVESLYARQLRVCPLTAEPLLLLADYLQLDCVTAAVRAWLEAEVLKHRPLDVCRLNQRFPGLDLFQPACEEILQGCRPADMAQLAQLMPRTDAGRSALFCAVADNTTAAQRLHFLDLLARTSDVRPDMHEALELTAACPELAYVLSQPRMEGCETEADYEAAWARLYVRHREATLAKRPAGGQLTWDLSFHQLRSTAQAISRQSLPDPFDAACSFRLKAVRPTHRQQQHGFGPPEPWLFVQILGTKSWQAGDAFTVSAVMDLHESCVTVDVPPQLHGTSDDVSVGPLSRWTAEGRDYTICSGNYLPLLLEMLDRPELPAPSY